ncbi:excalibur calcium-binding domain-containing protein [Nocardia bhagyanarayanae]|uniref:Excalibur calcium-binding domain-containing protein n=1 Tax=Nocardia bhagyanarayanae TaxID=1215925 RepID=A0A543F800_9NOCA|nr:excalibur calcium-binding domain-containing protein [Nocardia bhagyanarayanae]
MISRCAAAIFGAVTMLGMAAPAIAESTPFSVVSGPRDADPGPTYRPGPKGDNVPPPKDDERPRRYYANCDQVRAEGAWPLYRGEPGYASYLDFDGDGIACN